MNWKQVMWIYDRVGAVVEEIAQVIIETDSDGRDVCTFALWGSEIENANLEDLDLTKEWSIVVTDYGIGLRYVLDDDWEVEEND